MGYIDELYATGVLSLMMAISYFGVPTRLDCGCIVILSTPNVKSWSISALLSGAPMRILTSSMFPVYKLRSPILLWGTMQWAAQSTWYLVISTPPQNSSFPLEPTTPNSTKATHGYSPVVAWEPAIMKDVRLPSSSATSGIFPHRTASPANGIKHKEVSADLMTWISRLASYPHCFHKQLTQPGWRELKSDSFSIIFFSSLTVTAQRWQFTQWEFLTHTLEEWHLQMVADDIDREREGRCLCWVPPLPKTGFTPPFGPSWHEATAYNPGSGSNRIPGPDAKIWNVKITEIIVFALVQRRIDIFED